MTVEQAERLAALALAGIGREYPNAPGHLVRGPGDLKSPREMHPAFYGCYDWHSAVHSHWTLVYLLGHFSLPSSALIVNALGENLTAENLGVEADYLRERPWFERPYGWGWVLQLAAELRRGGGQRQGVGSDDAVPPAQASGDPMGAFASSTSGEWAENFRPLEEVVVGRFLEFLPKQDYPVRAGVHGNTAFALGLAFDYAVEVGNDLLCRLIGERARTYYGSDAGYPTWLEPSGDDFLSPCLVESDLMRRVLGPGEFVAWFDRFLPELGQLPPVPRVSDRHDPKICHLDGLCLSKAWGMRRVAAALPAGHRARGDLLRAADAHSEAGLIGVFSGDYVGEHWLASFAVYADR